MRDEFRVLYRKKNPYPVGSLVRMSLGNPALRWLSMAKDETVLAEA